MVFHLVLNCLNSAAVSVCAAGSCTAGRCWEAGCSSLAPAWPPLLRCSCIDSAQFSAIPHVPAHPSRSPSPWPCLHPAPPAPRAAVTATSHPSVPNSLQVTGVILPGSTSCPHRAGCIYQSFKPRCRLQTEPNTATDSFYVAAGLRVPRCLSPGFPAARPTPCSHLRLSTAQGFCCPDA